MYRYPVIYKHGKAHRFEIYKYPDGQQNVKLDMDYFNDPKIPVHIICSIRNFNELEVLLALCAAFRKHDFYIETITYNYLFGMRSDRSFDRGMPNYFRDIVAPIINSLNVPETTIIAPHSNLSLNCIKNAAQRAAQPNTDGMIEIDADEGFNRMNCRHYFNNLHFYKKRNGDKLEVSLKKEYIDSINERLEYMPIIVMDDLCDGGATFIATSEFIRKNFPNRKLFLSVTHGLFTRGVDHVADHYDKIYTTNSYQDYMSHPKLEIINVWPHEEINDGNKSAIFKRFL